MCLGPLSQADKLKYRGFGEAPEATHLTWGTDLGPPGLGFLSSALRSRPAGEEVEPRVSPSLFL
jgi:hypothetical protein